MPRGKRLRRTLAFLAKGFAFTVLGAVCLLAVALALLNLSPVKALIAARVNDFLRGELGGTVVIERIGSLDAGGASGIRVRVFGPSGRQVLYADGLGARVDTIRLVRSLLSSRPVVVRLSGCRATFADVSLDVDSTGAPEIARTFSTREPAVETPSRPGRGVKIAIEDARLQRAWAHGRLGGVSLDSDVLDARAALDLTPTSTQIRLQHAMVSSRGMPVGANPDGQVTSEATLSPTRPLAVNGTFSGTVGGVATQAEARIAGDRLNAWLKSERRPGQAPTLRGAAGLPRDLELRVDAEGPPSRLSVIARASSGRSTLNAEGTVSLGHAVAVAGSAVLKHVDLRRFLPDAPATDIGLEATATLDSGSDSLRGKFAVETEPSTLAGAALPAVHAAGTLKGGVVRADVTAADARGSARFALVLRPATRGPVLDVDAAVRLDNLARTTRSSAEGHGEVFAHGAVNLSSLRVRGTVTADAHELSAAAVRARSAFVSGAVDGDLMHPKGDVVFLLEHIAVGERRFLSAAGRLRGTQHRASFEAALDGESRAPSITARGEMDLGRAVTLRDVSVTAHRGGVTALMGASAIRVAPSGIRVEHGVALGLGKPIRADIAVTPLETKVAARAPRINLARLARVLGMDPKRLRGDVGADVDVRAARNDTSGHVDLIVTGVRYDRETFGAGAIRAKLQERRVDVLAEGGWNGARFDFRSKGLEIDGPVLEPGTWTHARGDLELSTDVDLERLRSLVPAGVLPFDDLRGHAVVRVRLERSDSNGAPTTLLSIRTKGLSLSKKGHELEPADSVSVQAPAPFRLTGVDVDAVLRIDPQADRTDLWATIRDQGGALAEVTFDSSALPPGLLQHPENIRPFFEGAQSHAVLNVPRRRFADFPAPLARRIKGTVQARIEARGTLLAPEVDAAIAVAGAARRGQAVPPFDSKISARYSQDTLDLDGVLENDHRVVLRGTVRSHAMFAELLEGRLHRFDVSANASLDRFPLESLSVLATRRIGGRVSGEAEGAMGTDVAPFLRATLDATHVSVGPIRDNHATVSVDADRDVLRAAAQVDESDGTVHAEATVPIAFPFSPPSANPPRGAEVVLNARNFRLAVLRPVTKSVVTGLDGRIDGNVNLTVTEGGKQTSMTGGIRLSEGAIELPTLGAEFDRVAANVKCEGSSVAIDDLHAEGTTGRVDGSASFRLSGFAIDQAEANLSVPKKDPLPVVVGGQVLGDAWGRFHATFARKADSAEDVEVDISKAGVRLPKRSAHALQSLEPADRVRIGVMRAPGRLEVLPGGPPVASPADESPGMTVRIVAKDVDVRRGTELRVRLDAAPVVKTGRDGGVFGTITLREGFLVVQDKKFEIEKGEITFHGDAEDPDVVVTAGYTAPEGTRVYADFIGPLKTGKVTLRSEPPHTRSEILSLVLFGTTTGNAAPASGGSAGSASAAGAASIGSGFAAQGLNRALDDLTGLDVTARVDTTESANPRPELEVRIARAISVSVAHVIGVPPPGTNPDRNFATVDFRIHRNWSVQTTVGDQGSSLLDLMWQYRY